MDCKYDHAKNKKLAWNKHTSLFDRNFNDEEKSFITLTPGSLANQGKDHSKVNFLEDLGHLFNLQLHHCDADVTSSNLWRSMVTPVSFDNQFEKLLVTHKPTIIKVKICKPGNTKGGSITVPLTSCLTDLESAV